MDEAAALLGRLVPPLILIVAAMLVLRRWSRQPSQSDRALRVLARTGLTRSAVVAIVAVGSRRFLMGASEAGVRMLAELDPANEPQHVVGGTDPATAQPRNGPVDRLRERTLRVTGGGPGHVGRT